MSTELFHRIDMARGAGLLLPEAATRLRTWLSEPRYASWVPELTALVGDEAWPELNDRFYRVLPFGTGGRRGRVGAGPNRINAATIAEGAQGVADVLRRRVTDRAPRVGVAGDTRTSTPELMRITVEVLAGNGCEVLFFPEFRPTPVLSATVRRLDLDAGIVISASHNPPTDNGFKVYWRGGGQVVRPLDREIIDAVEAVADIRRLDYDEALARGIVRLAVPADDAAYVRLVLGQSLHGARGGSFQAAHAALKIVFSPLHGTGICSLPPVLNGAGFTGLRLVDSQATPDGRFPNAPGFIPNPEITTGLAAAMAQAEAEDADVVLATDPDADRLAVAARPQATERRFQPLTGNEMGALLGHFVLRGMRQAGTLTPQTLVCRTTVTSPLLSLIARDFGVLVADDLLVGFKYIAEEIARRGDSAQFVYGTEESIGYVKGDYCRDKDAAVAALLACELAAELKAEGRTLFDGLRALTARYGHCGGRGSSVHFEGLDGARRMAAMTARLRENPPLELAGLPVIAMVDRLNAERRDLRTGERTAIAVPGDHRDDLVRLLLDDRSLSPSGTPSSAHPWGDGDSLSWVAVRPSGTEPKIKFYLSLYSPIEGRNPDAVVAQGEAALDTLDAALKAYALG